MRTKKRVDELEWELAEVNGRLTKLEWYVSEVLATKPVRKYTKSGLYTKEAKLERSLGKLFRLTVDASKPQKPATHKKHSRTWTDKQRQAQSDRMHKYWAERKEIS